MTSSKSSKQASVVRRILRSKFFIICAIIILTVLVVFLGRVVHKKYEVSQEINRLEERREELVHENEQLGDLLEYLKTDSYKDKVARESLGLQKEGETVIVIDEEESVQVEEEFWNPEEETADKQVAYLPNYKKWWNYFFATRD